MDISPEIFQGNSGCYKMASDVKRRQRLAEFF